MTETKREIFNQYAKQVSEAYGVFEDTLFTDITEHESNDLKADVTDARHMVMHLCKQRSMTTQFIHSMFIERGFKLDYTSVMYGIKSAKKKMGKDIDFASAVKEIA